MIYLFAGDDTQNKIKAYEKFLKTLENELEIFFVNKNNFDPIQIESFSSGDGLFFSKCAVVLTNLFEKEEAADFLLGKLPKLGESKNLFIFSEGKLSKAVLDDFKKARAELDIFELTKEKKEKFNNFLLADAFGERDKLKLWIYFRQAMDLGVGMEELVGVLFWKAKDMILRKNFGKFREQELQDFAAQISYLLPDARKRGLDAEATLEEFLLEAF
jgi:hypothetical protein